MGSAVADGSSAHLTDSKSATDIGATPHCGARLLSVEKEIDEISATGGHRFLSHGRRVFEFIRI